MTRQEAIEILEGEKCRQWSNVKEAFDVAVDAMKRLQKIEEIVHDSRYSAENVAYEVLYYVDTRRDIDL